MPMCESNINAYAPSHATFSNNMFVISPASISKRVPCSHQESKTHMK